MQCTICHAQNIPSSRFCRECGQPLSGVKSANAPSDPSLTPASLKPELVQLLREFAPSRGEGGIAVHLVGQNFPLGNHEQLTTLLDKNLIRPDTPVFEHESGRWFEASRFPGQQVARVSTPTPPQSDTHSGGLVLAAKLGREAEQAASAGEIAKAIDIYKEVLNLNPRYPLVKKRLRELKQMLGAELSVKPVDQRATAEALKFEDNTSHLGPDDLLEMEVNTHAGQEEVDVLSGRHLVVEPEVAEDNVSSKQRIDLRSTVDMQERQDLKATVDLTPKGQQEGDFGEGEQPNMMIFTDKRHGLDKTQRDIILPKEDDPFEDDDTNAGMSSVEDALHSTNPYGGRDGYMYDNAMHSTGDYGSNESRVLMNHATMDNQAHRQEASAANSPAPHSMSELELQEHVMAPSTPTPVDRLEVFDGHNSCKTIPLPSDVDDAYVQGRWVVMLKVGGREFMVRDMLREHKNRTCSLDFPSHRVLIQDKQLIFLHQDVQRLSFWSLPHVKKVGEVLVGKRPTDIACLYDGRVLVTNCDDGTLSLVRLSGVVSEQQQIAVGGRPYRIVHCGEKLIILHYGEHRVTLWRNKP